MCNSRAGNDLAVDICLKLATQNLDHENRLLYAEVVFFPTQNVGTVTVHDLKILPLLPRTIAQAMMWLQLLCMMPLTLVIQVEFLVNHIPLPKNTYHSREKSEHVKNV